MQKRLLPFLSLLLLIWGCGDAGIQSDISKNITIDPIDIEFTINQLLVGQTIDETPPQNVSTGPIDISDNEFSEYLEDSEKFTINKITYSIVNFPSGSEADLDLNIDIAIGGGADQDLLEILIPDAQDNVDDVILYENGVAGNVNSDAISALESAMLQGTEFAMDIEIVGRDVTFDQTDVDFQIVFKFDVTTRVQFDN